MGKISRFAYASSPLGHSLARACPHAGVAACTLCAGVVGDAILDACVFSLHADLGHAALQQARRWLGEELCGVGRCNVLPNA